MGLERLMVECREVRVAARVLQLSVCALAVVLAGSLGCNAAPKGPVPAPAVDAPLAAAPGRQTAVFAGGCFWGTQSVF